MLYYLFRFLEQYNIPGSHLWSYISFRALLALILSLVISAWFGEFFIKWMKRRKIFETSLPGVGRRTALRLALHMLRQPRENVDHFAESFRRLKTDLRFCPQCGMISDDDHCPFCDEQRRDHTTVCVVESLRDVFSIENTGEDRKSVV